MTVEQIVAEQSKTHWLDIYNRELVIKYLRPVLSIGNKDYIDIGGGPGYLTDDVLKEFPNVTAFTGFTLPAHDILDCKLQDRSFDAVSCLNVLEHIDKDQIALHEIKRILKPGGIVVATVPMGQHLYDEYDRVIGHYRRYSLPELRDLFRAEGFEVIHINYFAAFVYPVFYLMKKLNKRKKSDLNLVRSQNESTNIPLMKSFCSVEGWIESRMELPFGIRGIIVGRKIK